MTGSKPVAFPLGYTPTFGGGGRSRTPKALLTLDCFQDSSRRQSGCASNLGPAKPPGTPSGLGLLPYPDPAWQQVFPPWQLPRLPALMLLSGICQPWRAAVAGLRFRASRLAIAGAALARTESRSFGFCVGNRIGWPRAASQQYGAGTVSTHGRPALPTFRALPRYCGRCGGRS